MLDILTEEPDLFSDLIAEAKTDLASELMAELKSYTQSARDELAVLHNELGVTESDGEGATRLLGRVFKGSQVTSKSLDDVEGVVFGWPDKVGLHIVEANGTLWSAHVKTHLDKSYASVALRLFKFFEASDSEGRPLKRAMVAATVSDEARQILADRKSVV